MILYLNGIIHCSQHAKKCQVIFDPILSTQMWYFSTTQVSYTSRHTLLFYQFNSLFHDAFMIPFGISL